MLSESASVVTGPSGLEAPAAARGSGLGPLLLTAAAVLSIIAAPLVSAQELSPADPTATEGREGADGSSLGVVMQTAEPQAAPPPSAPRSAQSLAASRVVDVRRYEAAAEAAREAAADVGEAGQAPDPPPQVAEGDRRARLGDTIAVLVVGIEPLLEAAAGCDGILLYLDGMPLEGNAARSCDAEDGEVRFELVRNEQDDHDWHVLLGSPSKLVRDVRVSLGTEDRQPLRSSALLHLVVMPSGVLLVFGLGLAAGLLLFLRLARNTDLLRDRQARVPVGERRPYSLARVQMAWWFVLVVAAYVFIWLVLGELDTISESVLALIGIGSGTALGAAMIDEQKAQAERQSALGALAARGTALEAPSEGSGQLAQAMRVAQIQAEAEDNAGSVKGATRGFLEDVLSDGGGISFHRFQMLVWTLVLGIIFVASVYGTLEMPEFSATLLALMGISNGTYLGFKFPERFDGSGGAPPATGPPSLSPPGGSGVPDGPRARVAVSTDPPPAESTPSG